MVFYSIFAAINALGKRRFLIPGLFSLGIVGLSHFPLGFWDYKFFSLFQVHFWRFDFHACCLVSSVRLETSACTGARRMVGLSLDVGTDGYRSLDGVRSRVRLEFQLWQFNGVTLKCRACHFVQERDRSLGCFDWRSVLFLVSVTLVRFEETLRFCKFSFSLRLFLRRSSRTTLICSSSKASSALRSANQNLLWSVDHYQCIRG